MSSTIKVLLAEDQSMVREALAALLGLTEDRVSARLASCPRRGVQVLRALKTCRDNSVYNPGPGHTLGWLTAELFR